MAKITTLKTLKKGALDSLSAPVTPVIKKYVSDQYISLPNHIGEGYLWNLKFPSGLRVLISDCELNNDLMILKKKSKEHIYNLDLVEIIEKDNPNKKNPKGSTIKSVVELKSSMFDPQIMGPADSNFKLLQIVFDESWLALFLGSETSQSITKEYLGLKIAQKNYEPLDSDYRNLIKQIINQDRENPLRYIQIQNRVLQLLERFFTRLHNRHTGKETFGMKEDEISRLIEVESKLIADFSEEAPTINQLSKVAAMSPTKLKNCFKLVYGLPIYKYYQKNRMTQARTLLATGKYAVKEVGMMVGYSNLSHFANEFKKEFGMLPREIGN